MADVEYLRRLCKTYQDERQELRGIIRPAPRPKEGTCIALFGDERSLVDQAKAVMAERDSARAENEKLRATIEQMVSAEKSLQCQIDALKKDTEEATRYGMRMR